MEDNEVRERYIKEIVNICMGTKLWILQQVLQFCRNMTKPE